MKWIFEEAWVGGYDYRCSNCGAIITFPSKNNLLPECPCCRQLYKENMVQEIPLEITLY